MWRLAITALLAASAAAQTCNPSGVSCTDNSNCLSTDIYCTLSLAASISSITTSSAQLTTSASGGVPPYTITCDVVIGADCSAAIYAPCSSPYVFSDLLPNTQYRYCSQVTDWGNQQIATRAGVFVTLALPATSTPPTPTPTPTPVSTCGNSIIESGETCDDGNTASNDGCSASCICEIPSATVTHFASSPCVLSGVVNVTVFAVGNAPWVDLTHIGAHFPIVSTVQTNVIGENRTLTLVLSGTIVNGAFMITVIAKNPLGCVNVNSAYGQSFNATLDCPTPSPTPTPTPVPVCYASCTTLSALCAAPLGSCLVQLSPCAFQLECNTVCNQACDSGAICNGTYQIPCPSSTPSPTPSPSPVAVCGNNITEQNEECDSIDPCCVNCMYAVEGTACDDATLCNGNETCNAVGVCQAGTALDCNDNNQCTDDFCDAVLGCQNVFLTGPSCDDGLYCTVDDQCVNNGCFGTARDCADAVNCTVDSCDETNNVCVHAATDSLCPSSSCQTGLCNATSGCYTEYNPAGNCALSQGYWKNHYVADFKTAVNITYDNYICYTPSSIPKNVRDPLYWFNQPVKGSNWIPLAYQYYAAVANYNSQLTNKCCLPDKCTLQEYFGDVYDCFLFAQTALKTAFATPVSPNIPLCTTKPNFASSVNLTRVTECRLTLDNFNKGQGSTVPYCNGYGLVSETTTTSEDDDLTLDEELDITLIVLSSLILIGIVMLLFLICQKGRNFFSNAMAKVDYTGTKSEVRQNIRGQQYRVLL